MLGEGARNSIVQDPFLVVVFLAFLASIPVLLGLVVVAVRTTPRPLEPRKARPDPFRALPLSFPFLVEAEVEGWRLDDAQLVVTFARGDTAARPPARGEVVSKWGSQRARRAALRVADAHLIARVAEGANDARPAEPIAAPPLAPGASVTVMLRREDASAHVAFAPAEIAEAVTSPSGDRYVTLAFAPADARAIGDALAVGPAATLAA